MAGERIRQNCNAMDAGMGIHVEYIPGTFYPKANRANKFLIDRAAQRAKKSFSGVKGISMPALCGALVTVAHKRGPTPRLAPRPLPQ